MNRIILLDSGPLGLITNPSASEGDQLQTAVQSNLTRAGAGLRKSLTKPAFNKRNMGNYGA